MSTPRAISTLATLVTFTLAASLTTTPAPAQSGTPDRSFGDDGVVIQSFGGMDLVQLRGLATDGARIYASGRSAAPGNFEALVAAYDPTGALDPAFGTGGLALTGYPLEDNGFGLAVQNDGSVVVCANADSGSVFDVTAFRFDEFGDLDPAFDGDGMAAFAGTTGAGAREVVLDANGDILVGGWTTPRGSSSST